MPSKPIFAMIIKSANDKESDIATLQSLADRPDANPEIRNRIEQEIRNIRAGIKGEKEAAYEIDFYFGPSKNYTVIHDLRIEVAGRVAQIDHLIIGRFLYFWVCETKNFYEGIAINELGECSRFYNHKPQGMPSPFEQVEKHIIVLRSLFDSGVVNLPTRLGFSIKPNMTGVVLVSKNARISRPKTKTSHLDNIIKSDQFKSFVTSQNEKDHNPLTIAKMISPETLIQFSQEIAGQHKPLAFNWAGKFGLSASPSSGTTAAVAGSVPPPLPQQEPSDYSNSAEDATAVQNEEAKPKQKLICASCAAAIPFNVARFCWLNKARFGGRIYCRDCQKSV